MKMNKSVLVPDRVRKIDGSFSFIPHKFVTAGFFSSLTHHELLLYMLLVMVGDRNGLSYYSQDRLATMLKIALDDFIYARNGLIKKSLIAFNGLLFQVLALPAEPISLTSSALTTEEDFLESDPLMVRQLITADLSKTAEESS
jgi:hypothetical protein